MFKTVSKIQRHIHYVNRLNNRDTKRKYAPLNTYTATREYLKKPEKSGVFANLDLLNGEWNILCNNNMEHRDNYDLVK